MAKGKVAVLGSGAVGQTLATGFRVKGWEVVLGTQHSGKQIEWAASAMADTPVLSYAEAAAGADLVVIAVKGTAAEDVVREVAASLAGKTVIDTMNPIADAPPEDGVLKYFTTLEDSLLERLQRLAPDAHFVKAWNSVGHAFMVDPQFPGGPPSMFICGNAAETRAQVAEILADFGWDVADMGGAAAARAIEPLCILWCIPGFARGEWTHAFKLLKQ